MISPCFAQKVSSSQDHCLLRTVFEACSASGALAATSLRELEGDIERLARVGQPVDEAELGSRARR